MNKQPRILFIQHVPFETPGYIYDWAIEKDLNISFLRVYESPDFNISPDFDFLVIMGGTMNVSDSTLYSWLDKEKHFIQKAISNGKKVMGVCLGAQLLADVLGARVYPNKTKEIGWFPVSLTSDATNKIFTDFPVSFDVFHWHGSTFDIPEYALKIGSSEATPNQGFFIKDQVLAMQFHLELNKNGLEDLINNCRSDLKDNDGFVQTEQDILSYQKQIESNRMLLYKLLDRFFIHE